MPKILLGFSLLSLTAVQALAGPITKSETKLLTNDGEILYLSAENIKEAPNALGDESRMKEIGCILAKQGIEAVRLEPEEMTGGGKPWQVRLTIPGRGSVIVWGYGFMFTLRDGRAIPREYW
ncbi:hypothetical protein [Methylobacterium nigriterrae]|uniref:hypothetical protein n=1 Tax=Methylobacterium nigriterrae TaxID=3127512 RepID=UPI00301321A8